MSLVRLLAETSLHQREALHKTDLIFVPILGRVIECADRLEARLIAEVGRSFATVDLEIISAEEVDQLISESLPAHLEAAACAIRTRAAELRGSR